MTEIYAIPSCIYEHRLKVSFHFDVVTSALKVEKFFHHCCLAAGLPELIHSE